MRGIQNNFHQLQINQFAMEQAAIQEAKKNQPDRLRDQMAEEIIRQQEESEKIIKDKLPPTPIEKDGKKQSNPQNFKNLLYSKDGILQTNSDESPSPSPSSPPINHHIDFTV